MAAQSLKITFSEHRLSIVSMLKREPTLMVGPAEDQW